MLSRGIEQFVVVLEKRVLVARHFHPGVIKLPPRLTMFILRPLRSRRSPLRLSPVDGDEVDAFFGMGAHHFKKSLRRVMWARVFFR